jgi:hypothetical protein
MEKLKISSSLTFLYKYIIPVVVLVFNVVFTILVMFYFSRPYYEAHVVLLPFFIVSSILFVWPLVRLKELTIDETVMEIGSGESKVNVMMSEVIDISRFVFYFYKISYIESTKIKSIIVMPKISEFMLVLGFGEIESFRILRNLVDNAKR